MAALAKSYRQTLALHAELVKALGVGAKMPRDSFDALIMRTFCCGYPQAANVAKGGETLGLWTRSRGAAGGLNGGSSLGWIEIKAMPQVLMAAP